MERCQERQTAADVAVETLRLHSADVSVLPENTSSSSKSAPTFNLSSAVHTLPTPREAIPSPHFSPAVRSSDIFMVANASMSSLAQRFHDGANGTTPLASHSTSSVVEVSSRHSPMECDAVRRSGIRIFVLHVPGCPCLLPT
jgi:hypothetical protein